MSEGRVVSWTRIHRAPTGFAAPFVLILVQVEGELRWARGTDTVASGDAVRVVPDGAAWQFSRA